MNPFQQVAQVVCAVALSAGSLALDLQERAGQLRATALVFDAHAERWGKEKGDGTQGAVSQ